ncbi:MAG: AAA family ATPase [Desulfobacterales bacterium]|nr:MAG: AAA family ATPase [Desulfobacterales bacterium]
MSVEKISVRLKIKTPQLKQQFKKNLRSIAGFNISNGIFSHRIDLLIFELGDEIEKDFEHIHVLRNSGEIDEVFFISDHYDEVVVRQAMRAGAKEFFSQPIEDKEIKGALETLKEKRLSMVGNDSPKNGQIIHVIGSKGGVGATTVAVNLAASLAQKESIQSVALIDMNLLFGDIPLFLNIVPEYNWSEITKNISRLDFTFLNNILCVDNSGLCVIPSPNYLSKQHAAKPEIIEPLLNVMQHMFDYIVIDGGQSLSGISQKILEMSNTVLLVTVLNLPCLLNTNKLLKTFHSEGFPPEQHVKVIANRFMKSSDISLKDAEISLEKKVFWTIPNDYKTTVTALNRGKALTQSAPRKEITKNFRELATKLCHMLEKNKKAPNSQARPEGN